MATKLRYASFETALGSVALAWREAGPHVVLHGLQLPAASAGETTRLLLRRHPGAEPGDPGGPVGSLAGMIRDYGAGASVDFSDIEVAFGEVGPLRLAIYRALRGIGWGETLTYGELAARAGFPGEARMIGEAMGRNPVPLVVPCHRVVAANGRLGGFSAPGGAATKRRMLLLEGAAGRTGPAAQASFAF
jgi:methylated-DNA-[protein]-cysteine S-methyltransferase